MALFLSLYKKLEKKLEKNVIKTGIKKVWSGAGGWYLWLNAQETVIPEIYRTSTH